MVFTKQILKISEKDIKFLVNLNLEVFLQIDVMKKVLGTKNLWVRLMLGYCIFQAVGLEIHAQLTHKTDSVISISKDGAITWVDAITEGVFYQIEWASEVDGEWNDDWSQFTFIDPNETPFPGGRVGVKIPRFYKVVPLTGYVGTDIKPTEDSDYYNYGERKEDLFALGQLLFFDKILSGNRNTSCATCHHPLAGTGDGLSLPVGQGGVGLGIMRHTGMGNDKIHERVPRNAPRLFNKGAKEFIRMFHDGRVEIDFDSPKGFLSPAGD